jgi:hypothetical protein
MRIYLAGKYDDTNVVNVLSNIRKGINMAAYLIRKGYDVYCPFLDYSLGMTGNGSFLTKADYQRNSMAFVEVCDALLILPGWETSGGVKREIERAKSLNIPVYFSYEDLKGGTP